MRLKKGIIEERLKTARKLFKSGLNARQVAKKMRIKFDTAQNYKKLLGLTRPTTKNGKRLGRKRNHLRFIAKKIKRIIIEIG
jgi:hypothetical protein